MPWVLLATLRALLGAPPEAPSLREFLERRLEVDEMEWQEIQAGNPLVKIREGREASETRLMGVVKM